MTQWRLDGRIAVITGAGKNVGLGIARRLAESGAVVVVNDVDAALADAAVTTIRGVGGAAVSAVFDVTDAVRVVEEIARVSTDIGPVDILVNNAGIPIACDMLPFLVPVRGSEGPTWAHSHQSIVFETVGEGRPNAPEQGTSRRM